MNALHRKPPLEDIADGQRGTQRAESDRVAKTHPQ
jgi:hypothetical protein